MSERLQTDVPDWFFEWMRLKAPLSSDASQAQLVRYWLEFAYRQHHLQEMRATGQKIPMYHEAHAGEFEPLTRDSDSVTQD